jgi:hypothetical protein
MDEDTTTGQSEQTPTGAEDAQPVASDTTPPADAQTDTAPSESSEGGAANEPSEPDADEKLQKYAQSQGIELDSPSAIKAAKIAMKAQSEATRNGRKASELEKNIGSVSDEHAEAVAEETGQNPELLKRLQRVEVKEAVRDFWDANPEAKKYEPAMIEILKDKPHLAGDLDSLYANALVKSGGIDAVKSQTKRETLESLAHKQQAAVPAGNATNSGTSAKEKPFKDLSLKEMEAKLGFARR